MNFSTGVTQEIGNGVGGAGKRGAANIFLFRSKCIEKPEINDRKLAAGWFMVSILTCLLPSFS